MDKKINITLCCPSRGRPYYAKRMQDSALQTAKHPDKIKIKFYLNQDDPELKNYQCIDYEVGIDRSTLMSWNLIAESSPSIMYMLVGDDAEFITKNWDQIFLDQYKKYPDGIFMIGTATGKQHGLIHKTSPHPVITQEWRNALGYFWPVQFHHWCLDNYTNDLATQINRYIFLEDVMIKVKKITEDNTAKRIRTDAVNKRDLWVYEKTKQCYFEYDVAKLIKACNK